MFSRKAHDIDLGCSTILADKLERQGYAVSRCKDGTRKILYSEDVEIFENWIEGTVEIISGVPVVSVDGLIRMKKNAHVGTKRFGNMNTAVFPYIVLQKSNQSSRRCQYCIRHWNVAAAI